MKRELKTWIVAIICFVILGGIITGVAVKEKPKTRNLQKKIHQKDTSL
jgi:hypothetical protein